jgi:hypothetical protein
MDGNFTKPLFTIGALVFKLVGQAVILVAGVYLLFIVVQTGKNTIEAMPRIVDCAGDNGDELLFNENFRMIWDYTYAYTWKAVKTMAIIALGLALKKIGLWLEKGEVAAFFLDVSGGDNLQHQDNRKCQ